MDDRQRHGTLAIGDRNGSRTHPERLRRGDDNGRAKLTNWNVLVDIPIYTAQGLSQRQIAKKHGVSKSLVQAILSGGHGPVCIQNLRQTLRQKSRSGMSPSGDR
jgi:hypothetical protein